MLKFIKSVAIFLALIFVLPTSSFATDNIPFADLEKGMWYTDAVNYVYENGLMTGTDVRTFSPDTELSRAQLVTILWRMAGEPKVDYTISLDNVDDGTWYADAIYWALSNSIIENVGTHPNDLLTREETASIFCNYAKLKGAYVSNINETNFYAYNDVFNISAEYVQAMKWATGVGLLQGTGGGMLSSKEHLNRAQTAVLLQKFVEILKEQSRLSMWTENAVAKNELTAYISAITDENSEDFIPLSDRIAVFDLDGTLFCETDPNYFDYTLLKYRVLEDPDYKDKASEFEREVANKIKEQNETGKSFSGLEVDHGKAVASAFSGMTVAQFNEYIQEFKKQPMPSYIGMTRGEGFYKPMVQVVNYLQENGFTVYVVSGTDRLIVRGILDGSILNIPNRQIIGSDETIVSSNQGETDGLNYVFAAGDELILGGDFLIKNLKMNKVSVIMQEIGQQPVLSFGNSTGDSSMAEYVTSNNPYKSLAFMLCCDDTERENGSNSKADKMFELCNEFDWIPISMKNDWTTIYGENVTYFSGK
ncbi:MAG: S-layer homology domain-containing protein [Clostridia bacterium]|nr:S-layer homology domain-containing protein [Clostridia bacterium]